MGGTVARDADEAAIPERLDLRSHDIAADKMRELLRLFPEIRTEGDKIDLDRLKLALGESIDVGKERFGLTWPGKAECFRAIQAPSLGTLRPCPEESVKWDSTENLIIEGDNLEVLKLLQKSYLGKVKLIYIDPPYNSGNDFIYPDNFAESLETYLQYTGQVDAEGRKFGTNTDADGRFHSNWLKMMYPRLYLARNLLRDDGVICISIDDFERDNLRKVCDEIFGEENFVEAIIWKKRYGGGAKEKHLVSVHEYVLMYARDVAELGELVVAQTKEAIERYYTKQDGNFERRGPYRTHPLEATKSMGNRPNLVFTIRAPDGSEVAPKRQWLWSKERVATALSNDEIEFMRDKDGNWTAHSKQYLKDPEGEIRRSKAFSIIDNVFTQHGTNEFLDLFGNAHIFPFPKPTGLLRPIIEFGAADADSIILDFFAGSGTTAHAVMAQNAADAGQRQFILVQLPEPCEPESEAAKAGFATIAEITKERVRRAITALDREHGGQLRIDGKSSDRGFRVLKLAESNFRTWDAHVAHDIGSVTRQLEMHIGHVREGRTDEDILNEILLKSGFPPTSRIDKTMFTKKTVFSVSQGALLICLDRALTPELIRAIADQKPERVVCLDEGFAQNDQLKANAVQIFKSKAIVFKTV